MTIQPLREMPFAFLTLATVPMILVLMEGNYTFYTIPKGIRLITLFILTFLNIIFRNVLHYWS